MQGILIASCEASLGLWPEAATPASAQATWGLLGIQKLSQAPPVLQLCRLF